MARARACRIRTCNFHLGTARAARSSDPRARCRTATNPLGIGSRESKPMNRAIWPARTVMSESSLTKRAADQDALRLRGDEVGRRDREEPGFVLGAPCPRALAEVANFRAAV